MSRSLTAAIDAAAALRVALVFYWNRKAEEAQSFNAAVIFRSKAARYRKGGPHHEG